MSAVPHAPTATRAELIAHRLRPHYWTSDGPGWDTARAQLVALVDEVLLLAADPALAPEHRHPDFTLALAADMLDTKAHPDAAQLVRGMADRDTRGRPRIDPPTGTMPRVVDLPTRRSTRPGRTPR